MSIPILREEIVITIVALILISCYGKQTISEDVTTQWTKEDRGKILSELNRTTEELTLEVENLTEAQWSFRKDPSEWTIGEVVEHLEMQNQLHFREISVTSKAPQYLKFVSITRGNDEYFSNYASDTTKGTAQWFLEPLGRFPTKEKGKEAFLRARSHLTTFVAETEVDLRRQFTFRRAVEGVELSDLKIGQVRDLHQLLLTGIAHTDRHIRQIRVLKQDVAYPNE